MATINAISVALFNAAAGGYASEMAANGAAFANAVGPVLQKDVSTDALFVEHLLGNLGVSSSSAVYEQAKAAITALVTTKGRLGATTDAIDFLKAQEGTTNPYATIAANFAAKVNSAALFTAANSKERDITRLISGVTGIDTDVVAINNAVAAQKAADDAATAAALKAAQDKAAGDLKAANDKAIADATAAAAALKAANDKATADLATLKATADKAAVDAAAALKAAQDKGAADAIAAVTKALKDAAAASGVVGYETMTNSQLVDAIKTSDNAAVAKGVDITTDNAAAITAALKTAAGDLGVLNTSTMTNAQLISAIATSNDALVAQNAANAQKALDDKALADLKAADAKALAAVDNTTYASEQAAYDAAKAAGDLAAKALQAKVDALQAQVDAAKAITYSVSATATSVNEGATATFIIQTTGLADGASLSYTVADSISTAGRVATTSGTVKVDSSGVALVTVPVTANNQTDGAGILTLALINGKASKVIDIADTSKTQTTWNISAADISTANLQSAPIAVTVGNTGAQTVNLATDAVTATRGFTITGNGDITVNSGLSNDTITVSGNGNNTITTGAGSDTVIVSGTGNNTISVGAGTDTVTGGAGNDTIIMGSGALDAGDVIDGGAGVNTLVISGTGNVITAGNTTNIQNLQFVGTTASISAVVLNTIASRGGSITGSAATTELTITGDGTTTVDLTKVTFFGGLKSVTVTAAAATLVLTADQISKTTSIAGGALVTVNTSIAGFVALGSKAPSANVTVTDTAANFIANKTSLTGATLSVSGSISGADALALANAGVTASKTVSMTVTEALKTLQYPDQVAALSGSKLQITGNATYAQYASIIGDATLSAAVVNAYSASTGGYKGIAISDTTANLAAAASTINTAIPLHKIASVAINGGAALSISAATALTGITGVTGNYSVSDTAANINASIASPTSIGTLLTNATSVTLTTGNREVSTVANALELKALGTKLSGGYDVAISTGDALTTDGLSAIAGATKATLTGTVSVSQLNQIQANNSAATVTVLQDNAQNLVAAGATKLAAVALDLKIEGTVNVAQANVINPALTAILAKTGSHTAYGVASSVYTNGYAISDVSSAVLNANNATAVKGAKAVAVTNAMTLTDANALRALADASGSDNLANSALTYSVTDTASALATALSATDNTTTVATLAGAATSGVTATGTATVAQAKVLGTSYSSAVQVDSWAVSDTVANLFSSGSTLSADFDANTDAALLKATALSVQGEVTVAQMAALKLITTGLTGNATIFDNVYALKDTAAAIATQAASATAPLTAATGISLTGAAAVADLAGLTTLNTALTTAGKTTVGYALTDTIANVTGSSALGSSTASVVASAKAASLITATGNFTAVTAASLLDLADKAGTANYTVLATDTASNIAAVQAGVLGNSKIGKIVASDTNLSVSGAGTLLTAVGATVAAKVEYNLQDTAANLIATASSATVLGAKNIQAYASSATELVSVDTAQKLLNLTGTSGTVTYGISDTYANVASNSTVADGASTITVSNTSLTAAQYDNLINLAKATTTVATTVTQKNIIDTAANINAATTQTLAAVGTITPLDVASVNLSAAQARATLASGPAWKFATSSLPGGVTSVKVAITDTTSNLLAAKADITSGSATSAANTFILSGTNQYSVKASDVAALSASSMTALLGITNISAKYTLIDTADNLTSSNVAITGVSAANNITVTSSSGHLTTATMAKGIYDANKNVTFAVITDTASNLSANNGLTGSALVYNVTAAAAKATSVVVSTAADVATITTAKTAVGSTAITYSLSDTATNLSSTAGKALLDGATGLALSAGVATASEASTLSAYIAKFSSAGFAVTDTAANLVTNVVAAKAALGTVTVGSGTTSTAQYTTLKTNLGTKLASTTVTDTAAKLGDFLIGGSTAGGYAISGSKAVSVAQANALIAASTTSSDTLEVSGTSTDLLAMSNTSQAKYSATDVIDLATAKQMVNAFAAAKSTFSIATTADRFVSAYTFDTNSGTPGVQADSVANAALQNATTLTVDDVAITLGIKNTSLTASSRTSFNDKIVGTVDQIKALPANLKSAAGYIVVDSLANITAPANVAFLAASAGYVISDSAANITAAGSSVLATSSGALGISVQDAISVATLNTILGATDTDSYVKYSLSDSAANLVSSGTAVSGVSAATSVTVSGTATKAQADALFTANTATVVNVVDTGANIAASSNIGKFASIVADASLSTAGIQAIGLADANTIVRGKAATASLTFNVDATAADLATAIGNTGSTGANLATLSAAGTVSVSSGVLGTAATAAQAKALATITVTGGYAVSDTASALTTSTTVSTADLAKATVVKVGSGTATSAQATILVGLSNIEKGTLTDAAKVNFSIADSAKNLAGANATVLDSVTSANTVVVSSYTDALTAAEATNLAAVDSASTKLSVDWANGSSAGIAVKDTSSALLANGAAVSKAESVEITDAVSVATLNQVKAIDAVDSTVNTSGGYTYKLSDTASNLIIAGVTTVDGATSIKVTGNTSVQDLTAIESRAANSSTVTTTVSYDKVVGTEAQLFGSSGGTTLNTTVGSKATVISLTGTASVAQVKALLADSNFDGTYSVADTAANLLAAINNADKPVLTGASVVNLATGQTATVSQASAIASQLSNEGAFALLDNAANLNAPGVASVVSAAASVVVTGSSGNDNLANGTAAKVTYAIGSLANMAATSATSGADVLYLKSGDAIDLSGISDFDEDSTGTAVLHASGTGTTEGTFTLTRGYYGTDGSFVPSSSGTDTLLELETDGSSGHSGTDHVVVLVGVSTIIADYATGSTTNVIGFHV